MTNTERPQNLEKLTRAVVKVGDGGRGFVIETEPEDRIVITAAHCLAADNRQLPPAHPWSYTEQRTYPSLLGPLGEAKPTVWATCLFADPTADIAVLCSPDDQELSEQAEAYEELMKNVPRPFPIGEAPKQGTKRVKLGSGRFGGTIEPPTPGLGSALLLTLDGKWIKHAVERRGAWLWIDDQKHIEGGMSGSPIVSSDGKAIGLVSTGSINPILLEALPSRIGLHKARS